MAERKKKKGKLTAADLASYGITPKQPEAPSQFGRAREAVSAHIFLDPESHAELMVGRPSETGRESGAVGIASRHNT
ncbi:MAG: hypothetical protein WA188_03230 [Terriglobales bacterium]